MGTHWLGQPAVLCDHCLLSHGDTPPHQMPPSPGCTPQKAKSMTLLPRARPRERQPWPCAAAECRAPSVAGKCCGQTFLYTAFPMLVPKSLPNYTLCPCLSLVFKHPGLPMCQINSGEQLEQLPLAENKGRVLLLAPPR